MDKATQRATGQLLRKTAHAVEEDRLDHVILIVQTPSGQKTYIDGEEKKPSEIVESQ